MKDEEIEKYQWLILYDIAKEICPNMMKNKRKFNIGCSEIAGTILVEIRRLKKQIANQRKVISSLRNKADILRQLELFFRPKEETK